MRHLSLLALFACNGDDTDEDLVGNAVERIDLACTETQVDVWRPDANQPGLMHGEVRGNPTVSLDYGASWRRLPTGETDRHAAVGDVAIALDSRAGSGLVPVWVATADGWKSKEEPSFVTSADPYLPTGSVEALLSDGTRIGLSPTGRMHAKPNGEAWRSATDAFPGDIGPGELRSALGDIEVAVHGVGLEKTIAVSADNGHTWSFANDPGAQFTQVVVTDQGGILAAWRFDNTDTGWAYSEDLGQTWSIFDGLVDSIIIGSDPGEWWGSTRSASGFDLLHTIDAGRTWTDVEFYAGEQRIHPAFRGPTGQLNATRLLREDEGRRLLPILELNPDTQLSVGRLRCVESEGAAGGITRVQPSRDDSAGSLTLWDRGPEDSIHGWHDWSVPGVEPGGGVWPDWAKPLQRTLGPVRGMDWNADRSGVIALASAAGEDVRPDPFSTILEVSATGEVQSERPWDTYGELDEQGNLDPVPLLGVDLRVYTTGAMVVNTGEGMLRVDDRLATQVGSPVGRVGNSGHIWPLFGASDDGSLASSGSNMFMWNTTAPCTLDAQTLGCRWVDMYIHDYAVRDGLAWVLNRRTGQLWRVSNDPDEAPRLVAEGFVDPTKMYTSMHPEEPGIFIRDDHWYRLIPGDDVAVRP